MYILAIETTGAIGSVALSNGVEIVGSCSTKDERSHLKELVPMVGELLDRASIQAKDLDAVSASVGPGSFTGIRIGLATARGLSQALSIPCVPIGTLELFRQCTQDLEGETADPHKVIAILNARRGQVYGAIFDEAGKDIVKPGPYMLEDIKKEASNLDNTVWYGDGVDYYKEDLRGARKADTRCRYQTADMVARAATGLIKKGKSFSYEDMVPEYMRLAEAEQKLNDGTLAKMRQEKLARLMQK
jgi:tRNA threonylcarbamoyladenosine biosynthesis protein TsaB